MDGFVTIQTIIHRFRHEVDLSLILLRFRSCENFQVISPTTIIHTHGLQSLLGERSRVPDHNFLRLTYKYTTVHIENEGDTEYKAARTPLNTKIFKLKRISENLMNSELALTTFLDAIRNIKLCRESQNNIDELYESFCTKLIKEMNENIPSFDCSKKTLKRYKQFKP